MGWSVTEKPNEPGNFVLSAKGNNDLIAPATDLKNNQVFDNAVWRVKVWFEGSPSISTFLNWRYTLDGGDRRYIINLGPRVMIDTIVLIPARLLRLEGQGVQFHPRNGLILR
jgi:hypothetical protein